MLYIPFLYKQKYLISTFLHGITCCILAYFNFSKLLLYNSLLYFVLDIIRPNELTFIFHHLSPIIGIILVLKYYDDDCIEYGSKVISIFELANPLWILFKIRITNSDEIKLPVWYTKAIAGIIFIIAFVITRFIIFPYYIYFYFPSCASPFTAAFILFPIILLSCYWYCLLIKGTIKELTTK